MAVFFDALGIEWEYEKEGYDLGKAGWYLPDFWLPQAQVFLEIKPRDTRMTTIPALNIFLAGKMTDWRDQLLTRHHFITGPSSRRITNHTAEERDEDGTVYIYEGYTAPGFQSQDSVEYVCQEIWEENKFALAQSDCVFAWIDTLDAYGTLAEIAWAAAKGVPVHLVMPEKFHGDERCSGHGCGHVGELWVVAEMATTVEYADTLTDVQRIFDARFIPQVTGEPWEHILLAFSKELDPHMRVIGICGDPGNHVAAAYRGLLPRAEAVNQIWGLPGEIQGTLYGEILRAIEAARSARFEHGETPSVSTSPPAIIRARTRISLKDEGEI